MKRALRRWVVATSLTPLGALYPLLYRWSLALTCARLRRHRAVVSIYLRRGLAGGPPRPAVSDVDLAVVTRGLGAGERQALHRDYAQLRRWCFWLDPELGILEQEGLTELASRPRNRYRFQEAARCWKLLQGADVLQDLPRFELPELWPGLYRETKVWATLFVQHLLVDRELCRDDVFRNSLCGKVRGELVRLERAWFEGDLAFRRPRFDVALLERSWRLLEDTWGELLRWLERFSSRLDDEHPFGRAREALAREPLGEPWPDRGAVAAEVEELARRHLGDRLVGTRRCTCLLLGMDVLIVLLAVEAVRPPSAASVQRFLAALREETREGVRPYLLVGGAALALSPEPDGADLNLFTPGQNPEVFPEAEARWCGLFEDLFANRMGDLADDPALGTLEFVRRFWKSAQLTGVRYWASRGRLRVPTSPAEVVNLLGETAAGFPQELEHLEGVYLAALAGRETPAERAGASTYLRRLTALGR